MRPRVRHELNVIELLQVAALVEAFEEVVQNLNNEGRALFDDPAQPRVHGAYRVAAVPHVEAHDSVAEASIRAPYLQNLARAARQGP